MADHDARGEEAQAQSGVNLALYECMNAIQATASECAARPAPPFLGSVGARSVAASGCA